MQRIDQGTVAPWVAAAIYGKPGTGKSSFGVSAPKPLILLSEAQGLVHIQQAAQRLGVPVPPVLFMESLVDYRNVLRALHGSRDEPLRVWQTFPKDGGGEERQLVAELDEWPETIVLDSLTDCGRLVWNEVRELSPPKRGADGLPADTQRHWQTVTERMKNLILGFRDLPMHKVFLCLADDRELGEGEEKRRSVIPDMPGRRLPDILAAAVNVIGYTYRRERREASKPVQLVYGVMTTGPEFMLLKPYRPLRDVEVPNFATWVKMIHGELQAVPEAPAPSAESLSAGVDEVDQPITAEPTPEPPKSEPKAAKKKSSKKAEAATAEG